MSSPKRQDETRQLASHAELCAGSPSLGNVSLPDTTRSLQSPTLTEICSHMLPSKDQDKRFGAPTYGEPDFPPAYQNEQDHSQGHKKLSTISIDSDSSVYIPRTDLVEISSDVLRVSPSFPQPPLVPLSSYKSMVAANSWSAVFFAFLIRYVVLLIKQDRLIKYFFHLCVNFLAPAFP